MHNSRVKLAVSLGLLLSLSETISSVLLLREEDRDSGKNVITYSLLLDGLLSSATALLGLSPCLDSRFLAYSSIALCFSAFVPGCCAVLSANGSISQSGWDAGAIFGICAGLFLAVLNIVWLKSSCARVRENPEAAPLLPHHQLPAQALPYYSTQRITDQPVQLRPLSLPVGMSLKGVTEGAPACLICPISRRLMLDPVMVKYSRHSYAYDRSAIREWFDVEHDVEPSLHIKPSDTLNQSELVFNMIKNSPDSYDRSAIEALLEIEPWLRIRLRDHKTNPALIYEVLFSDLVPNMTLRGMIETYLSQLSAPRASSSHAPSACVGEGALTAAPLSLPLGMSLEGVTKGAPACLICPISRRLMLDPVMVKHSRHSYAYDRSAIMKWFDLEKFFYIESSDTLNKSVLIFDMIKNSPNSYDRSALEALLEIEPWLRIRLGDHKTNPALSYEVLFSDLVPNMTLRGMIETYLSQLSAPRASSSHAPSACVGEGALTIG